MNWKDWHPRTDKGWAHEYLFVYDKLVRDINVRDILEVGVLNGESIRMWVDLFPEARVVGADIVDCSSLESESSRIQIVHMNAYTSKFVSLFDSFDLIVEDGSHVLKDQCFAAAHYPRILRPGGVMIIEDIASAEDARVIQHHLPNDLIPYSYIIDRRFTPCGYAASSIHERDELLVVLDLR
jgi:SAM-dependent methyltransferase